MAVMSGTTLLCLICCEVIATGFFCNSCEDKFGNDYRDLLTTDEDSATATHGPDKHLKIPSLHPLMPCKAKFHGIRSRAYHVNYHSL